MTTTDFLSVAAQIRGYIAWASPVAVLLVAYAYVYTRTGSIGFLQDLVWRIAGGKAQFHNKTLQAEQTRIVDYDRFKYKTGIKFTSYNNICETRTWLRKHNLGIEELMQVRKYFDCHAIALRQPDLHKANCRKKNALTFFVFGAAAFLILGAPAALLTMKKTDTTFWATETSARAWYLIGWKVSKDECPTPAAKLDEHDRKVLCEIFTEKESREYLKNAMFSQKLLGAATLGLTLILLFYALAYSRQAEHAARLHEKIYKGTTHEETPGEQATTANDTAISPIGGSP